MVPPGVLLDSLEVLLAGSTLRAQEPSVLTSVLLVVGSLGTGGTERQVCLLANGLQHLDNVQVSIALLGGPAQSAFALASNVELLSLGPGGWFGMLSALVRLRRLGRKFNVVYSFLEVANLWSALALLGTGHRHLIWGVRSAGVPPSTVARFAFGACRLLSPLADVLVGNATAVVDHHLNAGYRAGKVCVIGNIVATERFRPNDDWRRSWRAKLGIDPGEVVVGCVARADPQKCHELLIAAFASVVRENNNLRLLLVGPGIPEYKPLQAAVEQFDLAAQVIRLGAQTDIHELVNAFDIAVSTSAVEGLPNNMLEAAASGVACIATDVGGTREALGDAGVLVQPNDAPAFARALQSLVGDANLRRQIAQRAVQRVRERFTLDTVVRQTTSLFPTI